MTSEPWSSDGWAVPSPAIETISVNAYRPHLAPVGDQRDALRHNIVSQAREIGSRATDVSEHELDALFDEAFDVTRGKRK